MIDTRAGPVFISSDAARAVFRWEDAIRALQATYGRPIPAAAMPPRSIARSEKTWLRTLPAIPPGGRYFGAKLMGMNSAAPVRSVEYVIVLFDMNGPMAPESDVIKLALDRMYRMPTVFGPAPGPRNVPHERQHLRFEKETLAIAVTARTDPALLAQLLPSRCTLDGEARLEDMPTQFPICQRTGCTALGVCRCNSDEDIGRRGSEQPENRVLMARSGDYPC